MQVDNLNLNHYLEFQTDINLPADFFSQDEYLANIQINDDILQVRFMTNRADQEKYGIILYQTNGVTYEYVMYISRSGPTVRMRAALVTN